VSNDPNYAAVVARLPKDRLMLYVVNGAAAGAGGAQAGNLPSLSGRSMYQASAVTLDGPRLQMVSAGKATNDTTQAALKALNEKIGGTTGAAAANLPAHTFIGIASRNLGAWAGYVGEQMQQSAAEAAKSGTPAPQPGQFALPQPWQELLDGLPGEATLGAAFDPQKGFGLIVAADAADPAGAKQAATRLAALLTSFGVEIKEDQGQYRFAETPPAQPMLSLSPTWAARGATLVFGTRPDLLKPAAEADRLALPKAEDAIMLSAGNFSILPPLLELVPVQPGEDAEALARLKALGLEQITWEGTATLDQSGEWTESHTTNTWPPPLTAPAAAPPQDAAQ
jgi:hypothetical protein